VNAEPDADVTVAARPRPGPRPSPGPGGASRPATEPGAGMMTIRGLGAALIVVAVLAAFVVLNVWLAVKRSHNEDVEHARSSAVAAARQRVAAMLSYDYRSIDSYLGEAAKNTTGTFTNDFTHLVTTEVAPAARRDEIDTSVSVTGVGVLEAHKDEVTLLVLVDQATMDKHSDQPRHEGTQLEVTMTRTHNSWLVSYLTEI
jgi:Mce-associated membrane protein